MGYKYTVFDKMVNIILPLSTIIQTYGWGKFDFAFISINLLIIWGWVRKGTPYTNMPLLLKVYMWYYLFTFICSISSISISSFVPLGWIRMFLTWGLFYSVIKLELLEKYYSRIAIICLIFFYIQTLTYYVTGVRIPGVFSFLPIALDVEDVNFYFARIVRDNARPCSFFSEPAHFAQFLIPLLTLLLFKDKKIKIWILISIIVGSLLLLKSGNGIIGLAIVCVSYIIWVFRKASFWKKSVMLIGIPAILFVGGMLYIQSEAGSELMNRQDQLKNDETANSGMSGFIRIYRGFYVYNELPISRKIVGANNSELILSAIKKSSVNYMFQSDNDLYFNAIQTTLIRTGLIGGLILLIFYINLYRRSNACGKTLTFTVFIYGFISAIYFTETMLLFLVIAYKISSLISFNNEKSYNIRDI